MSLLVSTVNESPSVCPWALSRVCSLLPPPLCHLCSLHGHHVSTRGDRETHAFITVGRWGDNGGVREDGVCGTLDLCQLHLHLSVSTLLVWLPDVGQLSLWPCFARHSCSLCLAELPSQDSILEVLFRKFLSPEARGSKTRDSHSVTNPALLWDKGNARNCPAFSPLRRDALARFIGH